MSSIWRCTESGSKETESMIKGVSSWLSYRIVLNTASGWTFVVNDGDGRNSDREMGRQCGMIDKIK